MPLKFSQTRQHASFLNPFNEFQQPMAMKAESQLHWWG